MPFTFRADKPPAKNLSRRATLSLPRAQVLAELEYVQVSGEEQTRLKQQFIGFARSSTRATAANNWEGHFFANCVIVHPENGKLAVNHMEGNNKWFLPGGHIGGAVSMRAAALTAAYGITKLPDSSISFLVDNPIYLYEQDVPSGGNPAHTHFMLTYLMRTSKPWLGHECEWLHPDEAKARLRNPSCDALMDALHQTLTR